MSNVVGLNRNDELIEVLGALLSQAKSGRLKTLVGFCELDGDMDFTIVEGDMDVLEMIGGLELLKCTMMNSFLSNDG